MPIEATDEPSSETGASSAPPSTGESRSDEEEDEDEEDATKERNRGPGERPDVGALPLMQLCEPTYGADIRGVSTPSSPHRASIDADGARSVEHRFTVTVRAVSFEAGALERVEGHIALVDLGQNAFNTEHGVRGRISEDMHFAWNQHARGGGERDESGCGAGVGSASTTGAFTIPARAATASVRALVQLTHLTPAAGGIDPKVYTRKSDKEIAAHLAKEKKRLDKGTPPGTFASGGELPKGIIAWAVLPIMAKGRPGIVDGIVAVDSMYRVKEAYTEAILLEAASSTSHTLKNHKPIRCRFAVEVTPLPPNVGIPRGVPLMRAFSPARATPARWWDGSAADEPGLTRDLFLYVDAVAFGRRKDIRIKAQLREDDLEIDAPGLPMIQLATAGVRRVSTAVNGAVNGETTGRAPDTPDTPGPTSPSSMDVSVDVDSELGVDVTDERCVTASWTPLSAGKSKGGAWSHEVRVRLPARLKASHHVVLSVYGRDAEVGGVMGTLMGSKGGVEAPLGHAILPLAAADETLAEEVAASRVGLKDAASEAAGGREVSLPAVTELLPKYLQSNVKAHMRYWEDRKPCVHLRLRACTNVHTSDEKIGAAYAAIAVAAEADIRHHAEELSGMRGGGGSGRRRGASASFGGNVASTRSHVRSAARGLVAALEKLPGAGGAELLRHLPAVAHLLLSIVAAPPTSIAAAVAADAAEAAALRAAKAAADEAARLAEAALERAAALGAAVNEATVPPTPYHTPHPTKHSDRGVGGDDSPTDDSPIEDSPIDDSPTASSTKRSASKSPSFPATPATPATPPFAVSQHKRSVSIRSTASSSTSSDISSLPPDPRDAARQEKAGRVHPSSGGEKPRVDKKKAKGRVEDGLRERAFACLVRVAARVQAYAPDDADECAPLNAFARRVFDDAKCTAGWRDAACALADPAWADELPNSPNGFTSHSSGETRERPPPMFPLLAGLYASALRGWGERDAEDARAVSWFVLKLVGRSVALHARREYPPPEEDAFQTPASTALGSNSKETPEADTRRRGVPEFAAAPPGPGAPDRDDPKFLPLRDLADAIGAELAGSPKRPEASRLAALDRELNLGFASLVSQLMDVEGPEATGPRPATGVSNGVRGKTPVKDAGRGGGGGVTVNDKPDVGMKSTTWSRRGDGPKGRCTAPLAPLACELAAAHLARLTPAANGMDCEFYTAVSAAPRFMAVSAAAVRGTGWSWADLAAEESAEEAAALAAAAAAEGNRAAAAAAAAKADEAAEAKRAAAAKSRDEPDAGGEGGVLISALAATTLTGLRSPDSLRRGATAKTFAAALTRHAWDVRAQSAPGRAAVAAVHAPQLRFIISHRDEIIPALSKGPRRKILAAVLSLARDADQPQFWTWLAGGAETGAPRRPPRLVSFLFLLCDALEAFERDHGDDSPSDASSDEGHINTGVTLAVLALVQAGQAHLGWRLTAMGDGKRRSTLSSVGGRSGRDETGTRRRSSSFWTTSRATIVKEEAAAKAAAAAAAAVSPARVFLEGSMGVLLAAMRRRQSVTAWRALSPLLRRLLWDHRTSLLAPLIAQKTSKDAPEPEPFPPTPAAAPGEKPYPFLEKASTCLLRVAASPLPQLRAEAVTCLRALLESALNAAGAVTVLRPMLTYALCAALYSPLGAAARRGALAAELASLRRPIRGSAVADGWESAAGATVQALESAAARLRELAYFQANPDVEAVVEMECAVAAALSWAPAAHCKALRSLSKRLEDGAHWVEAAEAAATAAGVAMQALAAAHAAAGASSAPCVWSESYVDDLRGICASLGRDGLDFHQETSAAARSALCGVEEISEEKVLAHIAEAVRLFVKGGHLEAAVRAAKVALPAWERRRAFGDLARAHTGIAGVYRFLHQVPPAGAAGSGSFGILPPPPGPPPPPATYYRVRLVGTAWDELDGRTWVHREPRERTLGDMLRRLQNSLSGNCPVGTPITPLPANGGDGAHDGKAHVQIIAVEPVYSTADDEASSSHPNSPANSPKGPRGGAVGGEEFPVASAFVFDAPFVPRGVLSKPSGPEAVLRVTWRCRTTARVDGKFPGLCARLRVTEESTTEMSPAASAAEMLRAQSRAIAAAATAWDELRDGATSSAVVGVVGGVSANAAAVDDAAAAAAAAGCLGALQRSLQGSLAAGVNGGVPAICRAFFPEEESRKRAMSDQSSQTPELDGDEDETGDDARDGVDVSASPKPPVDPRAISSEDRAGLLAALEDFLSACARAVEVHATATRSASAGKRRDGDGASTIEQMQGMFVRCLAEIRRDITVISDREKDVDDAGEEE